MVSTKQNLPRGLRNNNPLNLRKSNNLWRGRFTQSSDPDFEQFINLTYGIRAALITLQTYIRVHHRHTVQDIIYRWAPTSENLTEHYVRTVCQRTRFEPKTIISADSMQQLCTFARAMAYVECGVDISISEFYKAWDLI